MKLGKRISVLFGAAALASGSAFADAYAAGYSDVTTSLYNQGNNVLGGTGSDILQSIALITNANFDVLGFGPGSAASAYGGGLIDSGFDAGDGQAWTYFGSNTTAGDESTNAGYSDASNLFGHTNLATEDTYNEIVYSITNKSKKTSEWFNLELNDGVVAEVSLDNSKYEYGQDESILNFGYSNSQGSFTGNATSNTAYAFTGMSYGSDTFDYVENSIMNFYKGYLKPGQTIYFAVQTENASAAFSQAPSPAALAPFLVGIGALVRRRNRS